MLWPNGQIGFPRLPDWFFDLSVFRLVLPDCQIGPTGVGRGGVNSSGYTNLVCGPAKGSHTEDPKISLKCFLFKGNHTVVFWRSGRQSARSRNFGLGFRIFGFGGRAGIRADLGSGGRCQLARLRLKQNIHIHS